MLNYKPENQPSQSWIKINNTITVISIRKESVQVFFCFEVDNII